jgi:predicted ABC-type ATPase
MTKEPQIVVIGGPNGAGKSTIARSIIQSIGVSEMVNADVVARGLSATHPERVAFESGRIVLARLKELAAARRDFAFESTLAGRSYERFIRELCKIGWSFRLYFVTLRDVNLAVERVRDRKVVGGHGVPEEDVRRRFYRAHSNVRELYMPLAAEWTVLDNSLEAGPRRIATGTRSESPIVFDSELWVRFCEVGNAE